MYTVNGPNSLSPLRTRLGWPSAALTSGFVLPRRAPAMPRSSWMIAPAVEGASKQPARSRPDTGTMRFTVPPGMEGQAAASLPGWANRSHPGSAIAQPYHDPAGSSATTPGARLIELLKHLVDQSPPAASPTPRSLTLERRQSPAL